MRKIAQRRSILNKLHETFSPSGNAAEKFFNPQFTKVMDALRRQDNDIRSIVAGESIGEEKDASGEKAKGNPGKYPISLKALIKSARSNFSRREYAMVAGDLGRFHAKLSEIENAIKTLNANVDEVHDQFLIGHLKPKDSETPEEFQRRTEYLEHLKDLRSRLAAKKNDELIKEAGIMDFFVNIGTPRGRGLAAWEKKYPKQTERLKKESSRLLDEADKLLGFILTQLKTMASLRASRQVDKYVDEAKKIADNCKKFDASFRKYYTENVKGFIEKLFPAEEAKPATPAEQKKEDAPHSDNSPGFERTPPSSYGDPGSPSSKMGPPTPHPSSGAHSDHERGFEPTPPSSYGPPSSTMGPPTPRGGPAVVVTHPDAGGATPTMFSFDPNNIPKAPPPGVPLHRQMTMPFSVQTPANSNATPHNTLMGVAPPANPPPVVTPAPASSGIRSVPPSLPSADEIADLGGNALSAVMRKEPVHAHKKFYESLEKLADESPLVLASFITRYARSIQSQDPETAIALLQISKNIRG